MALRSFVKTKSPILIKTTGNCTICLNTFSSPTALKCGHTFCDGCLVEYWVALKKSKWFLCPLCRIKISRIDFTASGKNKLSKEFHRQFDGTFRGKPMYGCTKCVFIVIFGITCAYTAGILAWGADTFPGTLQKVLF